MKNTFGQNVGIRELMNCGPLRRNRTIGTLFLFLFVVFGSVQLVGAQEYAYLKIEDSQEKPKAIVAGDSADNNLYHQDLQNRDNGKWQFVPAGDGYYYIIDIRHGLGIVAGDSYDGHIYHQAPNNRDNAKWKLVKKGDNKFQLIDKKWGKAIVGGNNYDGHLYHQDPGLRSNAIWNITFVDPEQAQESNRLAPKEIVKREKFLDIQYDIDEKVKDNNSNGTTRTLSNKYTNSTSLAQSQKITASSEFSDTNSWENSEEVSNKVWLSVGTSFSYASFGATSSVELQFGTETTNTTRKSKSNSATYKNSFSFETNVTVPPGKTTVCKQLIMRETSSIPYKIKVLRTYGDNSTEECIIDGVWRGAVYERSEVTCEELS